MKKLLLIVLIPLFISSASFAETAPPLQVGQKLFEYSLKDQHEKEKQLGKNASLVIITFDMDLSKAINTWLDTQDPSYLATHKVDYVSDITKMPSFVFSMFAGPKLRKHKFPVLLVDDEKFAPMIPKKEDAATILKLNKNSEIESITFLASVDEIKTLISSTH